MLTAVVLVPPVLWLSYLGGFPFALGVILFIGLGVNEFYDFISAKGARPQRLLGLLCNSAFDRGFTPFLHVYSDNSRAIGVYRRMSFVDRTVLPFWALHQ